MDPHHRLIALAIAVVIGLLLSSLLVWQGSSAAFTASTGNPASTWASGSIALADNDAGNAMFAVTGLLPGDSAARCLRVTYTGDAADVPVRLYATDVTDTGGLGDQIELTIEHGSYTVGGDPLDCNDFSPAGTLFDTATPSAGPGTLAAFHTARSDFATGLPVWTASSGGSRAFRVRYELSESAPTAVQGTTATVTFRWETRVGA